MNRFKLIIFAILFATVPFFSCFNTDKEYRVEILGIGDGFSGYIKIDDETVGVTSTDSGSGYYEFVYKKETDSISTIIVSVTGISDTTSEIDLYIYEDGDLQYSDSGSMSSDSGVVTRATVYGEYEM